jgi:hypothetical protein
MKDTSLFWFRPRGHMSSRLRSWLKDRLGNQRGVSEWEPIKILTEGRTQLIPQIHNQRFPHDFAKVA